MFVANLADIDRVECSTVLRVDLHTYIQSDILQKNTILISGDPETEISIFEKVKLSNEHEIQRRFRDKIC